MKQIVFIGFLCLLTACSTPSNSRYSKDNFGTIDPPAVYTVRRGDTLFSIAWRYGLEAKAIQRQNGISNPDKIFAGQKLRLTRASGNASSNSAKTVAATKTTRSATKNSSQRTTFTASGKRNWVWPMRGRTVRSFNPKRIGANGIRIAGKPNQTVNAAEGGVVAYQGNGLNGYGNVVIIKHKDGLLSAYGFLSKTYVKEGETIKKRQKIGTVGYAANKQLMLHFEVRKNGRPINPKSYIGNTYRF